MSRRRRDRAHPPASSGVEPAVARHERERRRRRRLRLRRHGRRAYIRSVYSLPSLATLGNAICGFGSIYVAAMAPGEPASTDPWTAFFYHHQFAAAAYLIFLAMIFDALDGRLARFTRHTTDFGGQLDSLADVISFGAAPGLLVIFLFHRAHLTLDLPVLTRSIWAAGALFFCCAALRLARFNVSNAHGEQHHFSFLGLPSPGAAGAVAGFVLMQQRFAESAAAAGGTGAVVAGHAADVCIWLLPPLVFVTGLLMVSAIRYPHLVNRYLRGRRSIKSLLVMLLFLLLMVVAHRIALGIATVTYALMGPIAWGWSRIRRHSMRPPMHSIPSPGSPGGG
ncbi:MAG TPA: CDP-alcohol phosphatidyltransferase family protein [Tepidisphaeraceae bacterium]|jgi:CDP-diacylglycerol--serine O-phosphatidyltransferase|nr:CDP-alcohol phosphatidyltransferase family protein [Tepidisphaeraceae bacterium]